MGQLNHRIFPPRIYLVLQAMDPQTRSGAMKHLI
ncbi:MAG: hypothetical protein AVDCRST_MAG89-2305, partial [uncultured Gemmatimonadetes bacterium]